MGDFSTGKSIVVLATVVGCFAILWPRIFYPMMQTALSLTSTVKVEDRIPRQPPHMKFPPKMREAMAESRPEFQREPNFREGRPYPHHNTRQPTKPQQKTGGTMGIIMPIYTIAIVGFFLYTILKLVFRKKDDDTSETSPSIYKTLGLDPRSQRSSEDSSIYLPKEEITPKIHKRSHIENEEGKTQTFLKDYGKQKEDFEITHLRQKLLETEERMEKMLAQLGHHQGAREGVKQFGEHYQGAQRQTTKNILKNSQQMQDAQLEMEAQTASKIQKMDDDDNNDDEEEREAFTDQNDDGDEQYDDPLNLDSFSSESSSMEYFDKKTSDELSPLSNGNLESSHFNGSVDCTTTKTEISNQMETDLRQRINNKSLDDEFSYRNRSCSYSDVLNF